MPHTVTVSVVQGKISVDPDPCIICPECGILWVAAAGAENFEAVFTPGPFVANKFKNKEKSGKPHTVGPGKHKHKYTVTLSGFPPLDPGVIVDGGP